MQIGFLDHYDSFSHNLIDWLENSDELEVIYIPYDQPEALKRLYERPLPLVLSPGPHRPEQLPQTMRLVKTLLGKVPLFGVCLGHQCLGYALDGKIVRAKKPFHGSTQLVEKIKNFPLINNLSTGFSAAHYNSLVIQRGSIAETYVWALNSDGEIEGLYWEKNGLYPALGVQYHPESFLSKGQVPLCRAWQKLVHQFYSDQIST